MKKEILKTEMTLRDYFAAQALPQILFDWSRNANTQGRKFDFEMNGGDADVIAEQSYLMADSMMKMRKEIKK